MFSCGFLNDGKRDLWLNYIVQNIETRLNTLESSYSRTWEAIFQESFTRYLWKLSSQSWLLNVENRNFQQTLKTWQVPIFSTNHNFFSVRDFFYRLLQFTGKQEKERANLYSSLPLPPANNHSDICFTSYNYQTTTR